MAIRILRSLDEEAIYTDQSGRPFHELSSFKLVLTDPTGNRVPSFWDDDKDRLEEYFQREFVDESGTFGRRLKHWGRGTLRLDGTELDRNQLRDAAKAVCDTIEKGAESTPYWAIPG